MVAFRIRPAILLFGDSITQMGFGMDGEIGWASLLASDYSRRADVLNRGFSGYNTKWALDLLPSIFPTNTSADDHGILFCTLFFGANDAALPGELQHLPIEQYAENLGTIITSIRERTGTASSNETFPIILLTPPPFDPAPWRAFKNLQVDTRANPVAKAYGERAQKVGKDHGCSVLNVWELLEGGASVEVYGKYLSDGLHLNAAGNRKVHAGLMDLIQRDYPHLAPMDETDGTCTVGIPLEGKPWVDLC